MTFYAWRTEHPPVAEARAAGCPASGWVHARGGPPWRVVVSENRKQLRPYSSMTVVEYDGSEPTVGYDEWLAEAGGGASTPRRGVRGEGRS